MIGDNTAVATVATGLTSTAPTSTAGSGAIGDGLNTHLGRRGVKVIERHIMPDELTGFTECFLTGSAAEVTPVAEVGPYKFTPGNISRVLMEDYVAEVGAN